MRWRLAGIRCGRIVYSAEARTREIARGRRTAAAPGQESFAFCPAFGFSAHAYLDVQKADMFHMSAFFFGHRFAGRVRRGHRAMRAADGGPQPTIERSCPRGRRLRAAGQTAQAKWIAARLKTLSNHGPAGPIQIAGFVVGFGVRALAPGCAAPPARAAYGRSARRGL